MVEAFDDGFLGFNDKAANSDDLRAGVRAVADGCLSYELPMLNVLALQCQVSYKEWLVVDREVEFGFLIVS